MKICQINKSNETLWLVSWMRIEPILQSSIEFARIPCGNRNILKDRRLDEKELSFADHLSSRCRHQLYRHPNEMELVAFAKAENL